MDWDFNLIISRYEIILKRLDDYEEETVPAIIKDDLRYYLKSYIKQSNALSDFQNIREVSRFYKFLLAPLWLSKFTIKKFIYAHSISQYVTLKAKLVKACEMNSVDLEKLLSDLTNSCFKSRKDPTSLKEEGFWR